MSASRQRHCAGCYRPFTGSPVFREDTPFCCTACAAGALCACFAEADLADDGVDGIGLAFGVPNRATVNSGMLVRSR
jgi:hypothetical protein